MWGLRRMWENNIKAYLKDIVYEGMNWVHLTQDTDQWRDFVNTVMELRVSLKTDNLLTSLATSSFSGRTASLSWLWYMGLRQYFIA
jgi:hypothetical protein